MKTTSDVVVSRDGVDKWCVDAKQVPTESTEASQGDVPGARAAVCGHKDKLECVDNVWECLPDCAKGPTRCGDSVTDMFRSLSVANNSVFGCDEVQQECECECGEHVCRLRTRDRVCIVGKDVTSTQRWVARCGWQHHQTSPLCVQESSSCKRGRFGLRR